MISNFDLGVSIQFQSLPGKVIIQTPHVDSVAYLQSLLRYPIPFKPTHFAYKYPLMCFWHVIAALLTRQQYLLNQYSLGMTVLHHFYILSDASLRI
jgi:hypothetical protein